MKKDTINRIKRRENQEYESLPEEQKELVMKIRSMREGLAVNRDPLPSMKNATKGKIMDEVRKIDQVMEHIPILNITELNDTFFVSAAIVTQKLECKREGNQDQPEWRIRLTKIVQRYRKDLSRLEKERNMAYNDRWRLKVEEEHNIRRSKGYDLVVEEIKQRLEAT